MVTDHTITFFPPQNPAMISVSCISDGEVLLAVMSTTVDNGFGSTSTRDDYDVILKELFAQLNKQINDSTGTRYC
jgi:hypothetical protein